MLTAILLLVFLSLYIWGIEKFMPKLDRLLSNLTSVPLKIIYFVKGKHISDKTARISFLVGYYGFLTCIIGPDIDASLSGGMAGLFLVICLWYGWNTFVLYKKIQEQVTNSVEPGVINIDYRDAMTYITSRVYIGTGVLFIAIGGFGLNWLYFCKTMLGLIAMTAIYAFSKPKTKKTAPQMVSNFGNKIKATIHTPELIPLPVNGFLTER